MAREMKHQSWDLQVKRIQTQMKYPWHEWLNGSMWLLIQGEDFDMPLEQFRLYVLRYCSEHSVQVKTKKNREGNALYIKAYGRTSRNGVRRREHFEAYRDRYNKIHGPYKEGRDD